MHYTYILSVYDLYCSILLRQHVLVWNIIRIIMRGVERGLMFEKVKPLKNHTPKIQLVG